MTTTNDSTPTPPEAVDLIAALKASLAAAADRRREYDLTIQNLAGNEGNRAQHTTEPAPKFMDNPKACGAPAGSRWGYLPCGCSNDGHGKHVR